MDELGSQICSWFRWVVPENFQAGLVFQFYCIVHLITYQVDNTGSANPHRDQVSTEQLLDGGRSASNQGCEVDVWIDLKRMDLPPAG